MSEEDLEIVRRAMAAVARRPPDWDTINSLFDPKHELLELADFVDVGDARVGAAGFRGWQTMMDQTGDWRIEVEDVRATPDGRVAVRVRILLIGEHSGAEVEQKMCLVCSLQRSKVTRTESFAGWDSPLKALGLEE